MAHTGKGKDSRHPHHNTIRTKKNPIGANGKERKGKGKEKENTDPTAKNNCTDEGGGRNGREKEKPVRLLRSRPV
jgi:hypothetical protein